MDLPLNLSLGAGTNAARPVDLGHGAGSNAAQTLARHLAEAPPADGAFPSGLGASGYIPELLALAASRNSSMDLRSMSAAVVRVLPRDDSLRRYLESTSCAAYREAQFAIQLNMLSFLLAYMYSDEGLRTSMLRNSDWLLRDDYFRSRGQPLPGPRGTPIGPPPLPPFAEALLRSILQVAVAHVPLIVTPTPTNKYPAIIFVHNVSQSVSTACRTDSSGPAWLGSCTSPRLRGISAEDQRLGTLANNWTTPEVRIIELDASTRTGYVLPLLRELAAIASPLNLVPNFDSLADRIESPNGGGVGGGGGALQRGHPPSAIDDRLTALLGNDAGTSGARPTAPLDSPSPGANLGGGVGGISAAAAAVAAAIAAAAAPATPTYPPLLAKHYMAVNGALPKEEGINSFVIQARAPSLMGGPGTRPQQSLQIEGGRVVVQESNVGRPPPTVAEIGTAFHAIHAAYAARLRLTATSEGWEQPRLQHYLDLLATWMSGYASEIFEYITAHVPDLNPTDMWGFPRFDIHLRSHIFNNEGSWTNRDSHLGFLMSDIVNPRNARLAQLQRGGGGGGGPSNSNPCRQYNLKSGCGRPVGTCNRPHICSKCDGDHPSHRCPEDHPRDISPQRGGGSKRGRGRSNKGRGGGRGVPQ